MQHSVYKLTTDGCFRPCAINSKKKKKEALVSEVDTVEQRALKCGGRSQNECRELFEQ